MSIGVIGFTPDSRRLATCGWNAALLWDVSKVLPDKKGNPPTPKQLKQLWEDLASPDVPTARKAVWTLSDAPGQALSLLRERLKPVPPADDKKIARLITELDDEDLNRRERAHADLERLGEAAGTALRKALKAPASAEARKRLEELVGHLGRPITSDAKLRELRAIEVLEHIGNAEAVKLLEVIAKGAAGAVETEDAKASLERLRTAKR